MLRFKIHTLTTFCAECISGGNISLPAYKIVVDLDFTQISFLDLTLPPFKILSSLDSLNPSDFRELSIGAISTNFSAIKGEENLKN